jgi:hypothetical protein
VSFNRKPFVKPARAVPVRSSIALCTPVRMATAESIARRPAAAPAPVHEPDTSRATPTEREHMGRVKGLRCVLCTRLLLSQESLTEVHHLRTEQGGAQRASHFLAAALCGERCHRGPHGIHGDRALLRQAKCTEIDLLAWTLEALAAERETA